MYLKSLMPYEIAHATYNPPPRISETLASSISDVPVSICVLLECGPPLTMQNGTSTLETRLMPLLSTEGTKMNAIVCNLQRTLGEVEMPENEIVIP